MLQEFVFKLIGSGISLLVYFLPINIEYTNNTLTINLQLKDPVDSEIQSLVKKGHVFRIDYYFTIIINSNQKSYSRTTQVMLSHSGSTWYVNGIPAICKEIQKLVGRVNTSIDGLHFDNGDNMRVIVKARIPSDEMFTKSTGLQTAIVWNYHVPGIQNTFIFSKGRFIRE